MFHDIFKGYNVGPKPRASASHTSSSYPERDADPGAGLSGAPPTETGPTGLGSRNIFLCDVPTNRARAFDCGMEEVVSGATAFCRESTRAVSEESCFDILFRSVCCV